MCASRTGWRVLAFLSVLGSGALAHAGLVEGSLNVALTGRSDPRDGNVYTVVPVYAGLHLSVRELSLPHVDDLRLEVNGWLGGLLAEPIGGQRFAGDLDVFFVEARLARRHIHVRLGRQVVVGGVARFTHVDGASVTFEHKGLGLTVFGGVPVIPRFAVTVGEAAGGARLFYRFNYESQLGLSFIHVQDDGRTGRQDLGLDFRTRPHRVVTLTGLGVLSLVEQAMVEIDVATTLAAHRSVDVRLDFRHQRPDLFIPRASIFSVFSNSDRREAGGSVAYRPVARVAIDGDYHVILDETGTGHRASIRGQLRLGPTGELTIGTVLGLLRLPERGYEQARLFVACRLWPTVLATIDVDGLIFSTPVNGRDWSLTSAASIAWDFRTRWRLVASGAGSSTPFVHGGFDFMVKLAYNASYRFREQKR